MLGVESLPTDQWERLGVPEPAEAEWLTEIGVEQLAGASHPERRTLSQ